MFEGSFLSQKRLWVSELQTVILMLPWWQRMECGNVLAYQSRLHIADWQDSTTWYNRTTKATALDSMRLFSSSQKQLPREPSLPALSSTQKAWKISSVILLHIILKRLAFNIVQLVQEHRIFWQAHRLYISMYLFVYCCMYLCIYLFIYVIFIYSSTIYLYIRIYIFELYLECSSDPALQTLNIYSYILNQPTPTFRDFRGSSWRFVCISFHCCRDSTAFVRRMSGMELKEPKAQSKQKNPRVHRVRCPVCFSVAYSCCHMLQVNHLYFQEWCW